MKRLKHVPSLLRYTAISGSSEKTWLSHFIICYMLRVALSFWAGCVFRYIHYKRLSVYADNTGLLQSVLLVLFSLFIYKRKYHIKNYQISQ